MAKQTSRPADRASTAVRNLSAIPEIVSSHDPAGRIDRQIELQLLLGRYAETADLRTDLVATMQVAVAPVGLGRTMGTGSANGTPHPVPALLGMVLGSRLDVTGPSGVRDHLASIGRALIERFR